MFRACQQDILFFFNVFGWTYDPRRPRLKKIPFITWPYQDDGFRQIERAITFQLPGEEYAGYDIGVEKSRDMGASWMCCGTLTYRWLFHYDESYLMVSRKEDLVDGDTDSLFSHVDRIIDGLPPWMRPRLKRNKLKLVNLDNGSKIEGESTTEDIGRGGRRTAMLIDEFAAFERGGYEVLGATADNTNCRIFNSTPNGTANAFYAQKRSGTFFLRFHWSEHPLKSAGLYRPTGRSHEIIDHRFWSRHLVDGEYRDPYHEEKPYEFQRTIPRSAEAVRSPWYDRECQRRAHKTEVATQLDIDYQGSAYPFFDPATIDRIVSDIASNPRYTGTLDWSRDTLEPSWQADEHGNLRIWTTLDRHGRPPSDREYVIGIDISEGTGASNSVASVGERGSGTKVAELVTNQMFPSQFAEQCLALAKYFTGRHGPARMIWESNGPGAAFRKVIVDERNYTNVYFRTDESGLKRKVSDKPGFHMGSKAQGGAGRNLFEIYKRELFARRFVNPSREALLECPQYVHTTRGTVEHSDAVNTDDPSDKGDSHGDRVVADALLCHLICDNTSTRNLTSRPAYEHGSYEWRRRHAREEAPKIIDPVWWN